MKAPGRYRVVLSGMGDSLAHATHGLNAPLLSEREFLSAPSGVTTIEHCRQPVSMAELEAKIKNGMEDFLLAPSSLIPQMQQTLHEGGTSGTACCAPWLWRIPSRTNCRRSFTGGRRSKGR